MTATARTCSTVLLIVTVAAVAGCGGTVLLAYVGGGLPPGEPDLGGIVVASVDGDSETAQSWALETVEPAQDVRPVEGAQVTLMRGRTVVGRATTGAGGHFRFERPDSGSYRIVVAPPAGSTDLRGAERQVYHVRDLRTFVTIQLERIREAPGPGPGPTQ